MRAALRAGQGTRAPVALLARDVIGWLALPFVLIHALSALLVTLMPMWIRQMLPQVLKARWEWIRPCVRC